MSPVIFRDFDLLIERRGSGYHGRVINSPAGQASVDFSLPFTDQEIELLMLRVGRTRRTVRGLNSSELQAIKAFGGKLFETVFADDVRACLRSSIDLTDREDAGLRIRLRFSQTPELMDLPWEYLYNPSLNHFLALSTRTPIARYIELPQSPRPLTITLPLKILVLISSPQDYAPVDVDHEWSNLNRALGTMLKRGLVRLDRLDHATFASLRQSLHRGDYHILHYIGHGGFDARSQDGALILQDEHERARQVSGQSLGVLLGDVRSVRLALLNACEGARTSRSDPFAGVAQSLIQQGIPAVIAMQFEITDPAAIIFAAEFYGALAGNVPVDAALGAARSAIFASGNELEWGTPVLYMRSSDGHLFQLESRDTPDKATTSETGFPPQTSTERPKKTILHRTPLWLAIGIVAALLVLSIGLFGREFLFSLFSSAPPEISEIGPNPSPTNVSAIRPSPETANTAVPVLGPTSVTAASPGLTPTPIYASGLITLIRQDGDKNSLYRLTAEGHQAKLLEVTGDLYVLSVSPDRRYLAVALTDSDVLARDSRYPRFISTQDKAPLRVIVVDTQSGSVEPVIENVHFADAAYPSADNLLVTTLKDDSVVYLLATADGRNATLLYESKNILETPTPTPTTQGP